MRQRDEQIVVTHEVKSVRRHFINFNFPTPPPDDEEAFILRDRRGNEIVLSPGDFKQFLNCATQTLAQVTDGILWPKAGE